MSGNPQKWRCFHCDAVFTDAVSAGRHFGNYPDATPGCILKLTSKDQSLLVRIRNAYSLIQALRAELDEQSALTDPRAAHLKQWQLLMELEEALE